MKRDWTLHFAGGALIGLLAIVGYGREVIQHDWSLSPHQWWEAVTWPLGGLAVLLAGLGLLELWKKR